MRRGTCARVMCIDKIDEEKCALPSLVFFVHFSMEVGSVADRELGVCLYSHQSVRQTMKESNIVYIIIICEWFWLRNWYGKWCTTISWTILRKCSGEMCQRAKRIVFAHTKTYRNLLRDRINYWKCDTAWDVVCLPCLVLPANARIYL